MYCEVVLHKKRLPVQVIDDINLPKATEEGYTTFQELQVGFNICMM